MEKGQRSESVNAAERCDVAIVGAGIVGNVLATALAGAAGAGLEIAVIAPAKGFSPAPGRAIAVSRGAVTMLELLGIWDLLGEAGAPIERILVTDGWPGGTELSLLEFDHRAAGPSAVVVEEPLLAAACAASSRSGTGVRMVDDRVAGLEVDGFGARLTLASGNIVSAALVVAADGARSAVRKWAGIKTIGWDYGQSGLVAWVEHDRPHGGVAVERFLPAGPFAILPLSGTRSALVWTEATGETERLSRVDEGAFAAALALRWAPERGKVTSFGDRASFPLAFHIARRFAAQRLALVGDAAHQVHPLGGQGLNLGLRDVAALAEEVVEARRLGLDPGDAPALERYERRRRFDTIGSALAYDSLNRLFTNDRDALRALRDIGLGIVNRLGPLKQALMREAAGLSGSVPRLMTGMPL